MHEWVKASDDWSLYSTDETAEQMAARMSTPDLLRDLVLCVMRRERANQGGEGAWWRWDAAVDAVTAELAKRIDH